MMPTYQEVADYFGFKSVNSVTEYVQRLTKKGLLLREPGKARSFSVALPYKPPKIVDIPILGSIPAGHAEDVHEETLGWIGADVAAVGAAPGARMFAIRAEGDSMIGRHIVSGDTVLVEQGASPKPGDIVAALMDGRSTLKTYAEEDGRIFLRAENPRFPTQTPIGELIIQGVMVGLIRSRRVIGSLFVLSLFSWFLAA
jgi:repressor LexA